MSNIFTPGPTPNTVRATDGRVLAVPEGWVLLPPGDAALTRRVKAAGDHWIVQEKRGRKVFSRGVWASAVIIERIRGRSHPPRPIENPELFTLYVVGPPVPSDDNSIFLTLSYAEIERRW